MAPTRMKQPAPRAELRRQSSAPAASFLDPLLAVRHDGIGLSPELRLFEQLSVALAQRLQPGLRNRRHIPLFQRVLQQLEHLEADDPTHRLAIPQQINRLFLSLLDRLLRPCLQVAHGRNGGRAPYFEHHPSIPYCLQYGIWYFRTP